MYQEIHTDDIEARAHAFEVGELLRHYARCTDSSGSVEHEHFLAQVMPHLGDDLMIIEPTDDHDYRWTHFGREIVRYIGGTRLGQSINSLRPQLARFTRQCFDRAIGEARPLYTVHRSKGIVRVVLWERLLLPTVTREGRPMLVVFGRPLQFREDLLDAVMRTSPSGIVALRAVRDGTGQVARTFILAANQRAALLTGQKGVDFLDQEARKVLPFLADTTIWNRCLIAIGQQKPDCFETELERDGHTTWLRVAIAPLGDGLLLTLSDITDLTLANRRLQQRAASLALEVGLERASRRALSEEIGQREEREKELRRLAETDPLTALLNRRSFTDRANAALESCAVEGADVSLIIVDLDHFKQINDSHGHPAGDAVIRAVADLLLNLFRGECCLVGRFGGEEFGVLVKGGAQEALEKTRRIQEALSVRALPVSETLELVVTASCGVATRQDAETLAGMTSRADQALYRAKKEGRNRIALAGGEATLAAAA